jgi:hypothetical protein
VNHKWKEHQVLKPPPIARSISNKERGENYGLERLPPIARSLSNKERGENYGLERWPPNTVGNFLQVFAWSENSFLLGSTALAS